MIKAHQIFLIKKSFSMKRNKITAQNIKIIIMQLCCKKNLSLFNVNWVAQKNLMFAIHYNTLY